LLLRSRRRDFVYSRPFTVLSLEEADIELASRGKPLNAARATGVAHADCASSCSAAVMRETISWLRLK
jgi:hypothetical protein